MPRKDKKPHWHFDDGEGAPLCGMIKQSDRPWLLTRSDEKITCARCEYIQAQARKGERVQLSLAAGYAELQRALLAAGVQPERVDHHGFVVALGGARFWLKLTPASVSE